VKGAYPLPGAIAQTVAHPQTSLSGARRFYASTGAVVYAGEHSGMANVAGRVWLAPRATRRLSTFLDMITPAVGGLLMAPSGVQPLRLEIGGPDTAAGRLRELAEAHLQHAHGEHHTSLCAVQASASPGWDWSGTLAYDHLYRLRSGEYVTSRPQVIFHVRSDSHPTRAHIMVEIRQPRDLDHVYKWVALLLPPAERWSVTPFTLLDDQTRHEEIRCLVDALGAGGEVTVAHPHTERVRDSAPDPDLGEFVAHMREARYSTSIQGLDSLIQRAELVDRSLLSAFDLYHWQGTGPNRAAVRVRIKQHDTNPLMVAWGAAREPRTTAGVPLAGKVSLDSEGWETMTAITWSEDQRMAHLHTLWLRLIAATQDAAGVVAA
jgi:hypothetical protein